MTAPSSAAPAARRPPVRRAVLAAIGFYSRAISPALPPRCRFYPTCSAYAAEAIELHGAGRGTWLALRRLVKCAPWHPGGIDPVPGSPTHLGTGSHGCSSSTPGASAAAGVLAGDPVADPGVRTTDRATSPAARRAPMEESSLA
jgi:putative membrane protein insertion efficiency factor